MGNALEPQFNKFGLEFSFMELATEFFPLELMAGFLGKL